MKKLKIKLNENQNQNQNFPKDLGELIDAADKKPFPVKKPSTYTPPVTASIDDLDLVIINPGGGGGNPPPTPPKVPENIRSWPPPRGGDTGGGIPNDNNQEGQEGQEKQPNSDQNNNNNNNNNNQNNGKQGQNQQQNKQKGKGGGGNLSKEELERIKRKTKELNDMLKGGGNGKEKNGKKKGKSSGKSGKELADELANELEKHTLDDHSQLPEVGRKGEPLLKDAYNDVKDREENVARRRRLQGSTGYGNSFTPFGYDSLELAINNLNKANIETKKIKKLLSKFKDTLHKIYYDKKSYTANVFSASSNVSPNIIRRARMSEETNDQVAILIFAVDVSGSMGELDLIKFATVFKRISVDFESKYKDIKGYSYLLSWDTGVYSLRRFSFSRMKQLAKKVNDKITKKAKQGVLNLGGGGGGTDPGSIFRFIEQRFIYHKKNGLREFVWNIEDDNLIDGALKLAKKGQKIIQQGIKKDATHVIPLYTKEAKPKTPIQPDKGKINKQEIIDKGIPIYTNTKVGPVPYIIVLTDGHFAKPSLSGTIYEKYPGNILYVTYTIEHINPKNFILVEPPY